MVNKDLSEFTDQELRDESKKLKSFSFVNALYPSDQVHLDVLRLIG